MFGPARRFRILAVIGDYSRECLALVADTSLSGARVARELDRLIRLFGKPETIVSDNGTELTSWAILEWQNKTGVGWHYIAPGKPQQNGFVESFIGRLAIPAMFAGQGNDHPGKSILVSPDNSVLQFHIQ